MYVHAFVHIRRQLEELFPKATRLEITNATREINSKVQDLQIDVFDVRLSIDPPENKRGYHTVFKLKFGRRLLLRNRVYVKVLSKQEPS